MSGPAERPLAGRRILLTRPAGQGGELAERLLELGAVLEHRPVIELVPPSDPAPPRAALARLDRFDWVLFTSANGVRFFFELATGTTEGPPASLPAVGCVGAATARALTERGVTATVVAQRSQAEGLFEALEPRIHAGQRVLLVRPEVSRPVLRRLLERAGVIVDAPVFYRNVPADGLAELLEALGRGRYDAVVLTAPSTLRSLLQASDRAGRPGRQVLRGLPLVAIGDVTAAAIREEGFAVGAVAAEPSDAGLLGALRALFAG